MEKGHLRALHWCPYSSCFVNTCNLEKGAYGTPNIVELQLWSELWHHRLWMNQRSYSPFSFVSCSLSICVRVPCLVVFVSKAIRYLLFLISSLKLY